MYDRGVRAGSHASRNQLQVGGHSMQIQIQMRREDNTTGPVGPWSDIGPETPSESQRGKLLSSHNTLSWWTPNPRQNTNPSLAHCQGTAKRHGRGSAEGKHRAGEQKVGGWIRGIIQCILSTTKCANPKKDRRRQSPGLSCTAP